MKKKSIFLGILGMIILSGVAFYTGLHWKDHEGRVQLTSALGTQMVCEASSLEGDVTIASLLDKENSSDAKDTLIIEIKSRIVKLKAFEPSLNKSDQAMVKDAMQDGETYLSTSSHH